MATIINIKDLSFSFDKKKVLDSIGFTVSKGEAVVLLGPSGTGKSTLLKLLAGLISPQTGTIEITPAENAIGSRLVFQEHRLFPWLTVRGNLEFALRSAGVDQAEWPDRYQPLLREVGLAEEENLRVKELSIGMAQRVSLVRALCCQPQILLLDEPFSALDPARRSKLQQELLRLKEITGVTVVMVTHDIQEAINIGDQILILNGSPASISQMLHRGKLPNSEMYAQILQALVG